MSELAMTEADYRAYLDADVWAFIEETWGWYPPDTIDNSVEEQRNIYDRMCRAFFNGYPEGVTARDESARDVPLRHYRRASPESVAIVLYAHGGGFMVGGLDSHDDVCAEICATTGLDVVAVDYRLVPEFTRIEAFEDCQTALAWVRHQFNRPIILAGDSAGGFLSAALAIEERKAGDIAGQVLIYPSLGRLTESSGSMLRHARAPLLLAEEVAYYGRMMEQAEAGREANFTIPLALEEFGNLPPAYVAPAECDPICDDSLNFHTAIQRDGGVSELSVDEGLVHGHLRARHRAKRSGASFARICDAISRMASGQFGT